ncbi:MAG TPA: diacylglycerol kinase family protein [Pyrinomonadaceae bacterium]
MKAQKRDSAKEKVEMSSLPLVIVNPASAGGATGEAWPGVASDLRRHFGPFACAFTERSGDARVIAEHEAARGRSFIIACGGDGTVNEIADGLLRSGADAELGVLPSGTGGDFRRTLEIPERAADAARALRDGRTMRVDAGRVVFAGESGGEETRHFINVASFGMGVEVIGRVKKDGGSGATAAATRALGGKAAFAVAALQSAFAYAQPLVRITLDGGPEFRLKITNFCVANARFFGGGMKIAPEAKLDDGLFDVVAIGDMSGTRILTNSYRVYLGTHLGLRQVQHTRARRVLARADDDGEVGIEIDGETAGRLPATFEILPRSLRVRAPR